MKKSQVYLLILVLAVLSYAYFVEYRGSEKKLELENQQAKLIDFQKDQINRIELKTEVSEKPVILNKNENGWTLESPIEEIADNQRVDEFLNPLVEEMRSAIAQSGEKIDWKTFGLEVPAGQIVLRTNLGQSVEFSVSNLKNFEGESFIRKNNENSVYTASASWLERIYKNETFFRDRSILRKPIAGVRELILKEKKQLTLSFDTGEWSLTPAPKGKLNQNKLREIVNAFADAKAESFEVKKPEAQKIMTAELNFLDESQWVAEFFESKDQEIYVKVRSMPNYMKIGSVFWSKVYNIQVDQLIQKTELKEAVVESEKK